MSERAGAVLVQIGDLHIGADWVDTDPRESLAATVDAIRALDLLVDGVLVLGDLTEHGTEREYATVREELARLELPVHLAMGNHDDRATLCRHLGVGAADGSPLNHAAALGPVRLLVLDTTIPGEGRGALLPESLDWLELQLVAFPDTPTLLAMHHPPLLTGSPAWDQYALATDSREALGEALQRHRQVRRILSAHLHRPLTAEFASRPVLVAPSTYVQFPLRAHATELVATAEPPGYLLHVIAGDGTLTSYVESVR